MAIELATNKTHIVVKRDGREEPYSEAKMKQVLMWACQGSEPLADSILEAIEIRIYNKIAIETLFDEVIDTVYNMISRLTPQYEEVLKRLFIQKTYKELWGIKRAEYPTLAQYFAEFSGQDKELIDPKLSPTELEQLDLAIKPERDLLSPYLGLTVFFEKYSIRGKELLQHGFMRVAIQPYVNDTSPNRIQKIINRYNNLSLGYYTEATPKFKNSLKHKFYGASCCVHKSADNSESINAVTSDIGQYSRADGGNACDVSDWRASNSTIGLVGKSDGPIPFIKKLEASVNAFNQNSTRPGVCAVYYQWWHADVMALLPLMDEGGKENQRARGLKFGIKLNRLFLRAITANEDVHLFDPKVVPHLNNLFGTEFDEAYDQAVKAKLYTSVIPARTIALAIAKERLETGNLYIFFIENANEHTPFNDIIHSSNLCMEIFLPTIATEFNKSRVVTDLSTGEAYTESYNKTGLTALCNLSSINVDKWINMSSEERDTLAAELLESSDNLIDLQSYPTPEGELFNRNYRAIGIGMNNLAYAFASRNIKFTDDDAKVLMEEISSSIHEVFNRASYNLAIQRGNFLWHNKTKLSEPRRFATLFALPPGATNSLIIGATEGTEPVSKLLSEKTGTYSSKQLVPELLKYGMNYQLAAEIPTKVLYDLAAIRQRYLDQGQSLNTYAKDPSSAYEVVNAIIYAESVGLKSLYYLQSNTAVDECLSCGA